MVGRGRDCAEICVLFNVHHGDIHNGIVGREWSAMVGKGTTWMLAMYKFL